MIHRIDINEEERGKLEKAFTDQYPSYHLEYDNEYAHYYIIETASSKRFSKNISAYELYHRILKNK